MRDLIFEIVRKTDNKAFQIGYGQYWRILKKGVDGFGSFTNSISFENNAFFDGGNITGSSLGKVNRTIKCAYLNFDDMERARAEVLAFFNPKEEYRVYITYAGRKMWADGVLYKFAFNMNANGNDRLELQTTFTFAEPYLKSFDDYGKDIAMKTGKMAFPYMVAANLGLTGGIFDFSKQVTILNSGDVDTRCRAIIKANGEVVNPKLIINTEFIKIIDTLEAGDEIEMDFTVLPPTIKKNGVNWLGHADRTSSFFDMIINRGANTIGFDADDGDSHLSVSIYYNNLYAAI